MPAPPPYLDTPAGLISAGRVHYRTTEALVADYAAGVLDRTPLAELVPRADVWLRSPTALAIATLPLSAWLLPWWAGPLVAVAVYALWWLASPGLVLRALVPAFAFLEHPLVQIVGVGAPLSLLAVGGTVAPVLAALAAFVAFRLGGVQAALDPLLARLRPDAGLPRPDRVLRAVIVREALRLGVALPGFEEIQG